MTSRLWGLGCPNPSHSFATRRDEIKWYAYRISSGVLVVSFGVWGTLFVVNKPQYMLEAFHRFVHDSPIKYLPFKFSASFYMTSIGVFEVVCANLMVFKRDKPRLQCGITCALLVLMAGAVYSLYFAGEPLWKYGTPVSLGCVLLVRLLSSPCCCPSIKED